MSLIRQDVPQARSSAVPFFAIVSGVPGTSAPSGTVPAGDDAPEDGTETTAVTWSGPVGSGRNRPRVTIPAAGGASASNQKLYIVAKRSALVSGFCAKVSGLDHVTSLEETVLVQSLASNGSPEW